MQLIIDLEEPLADKLKSLMHTDNLKKAVESSVAKMVKGQELNAAQEIEASLADARTGKTKPVDALLHDL